MARQLGLCPTLRGKVGVVELRRELLGLLVIHVGGYLHEERPQAILLAPVLLMRPAAVRARRKAARARAAQAKRLRKERAAAGAAVPAAAAVGRAAEVGAVAGRGAAGRLQRCATA